MAVSTLKGKFVRRDGAGNIVFGSSKKPEWSPMRPACDTARLEAGQYYEIDVSGGALMDVRPLPDSMPSSYGAGAPDRAPSGGGGGLSQRDYLISATGIAKSLIESGTPVEKALPWAMSWVGKWGHVSAPVVAPEPPQAPPAPPPQAGHVEMTDADVDGPAW